MQQLERGSVITIVLILSIAVPLGSVTVSPALCPTNKIAPHRKIGSLIRPNGRTFAAYYDLLTPDSSHTKPQDQASLQEQPQFDQSNDCGDIEDYDENDLSSVTPQRETGNDQTDQRWLFGLLANRPPQQLPAYSPPKPPVNVPQQGSQRPPYWSGGLLGNNYYKPPGNYVPSDTLKPVHEASHDSEVQQSYWHDVVGGPISHIVGLTRPTTVPTHDETIRKRLEYIDSLRRQSTQPSYGVTRRPRPRKLSNDNTVLGSFIDLFFK